MTYLITFSCYGTHLRGHALGSVDRRKNRFGSPSLPPTARRVSSELARMEYPQYRLDSVRRSAVLRSLRERCHERGWSLLAVHVRETHVHVVVEGACEPERMMNDLKSYASRVLNRAQLDESPRKRWTRHGSTRWLWDSASVSAAIRYVAEGQGMPMELLIAETDR